MSVAENIKRIRKKRGFTQKELGNLCGINEANIRKYENDRQNPKIETLQKIANALRVNITELLDLPQLQDHLEDTLFYLTDMNSEGQDIRNIVSMIEDLGFEYIASSEDDKVILYHKHTDTKLQQYFYVSLKDINKIIEEYEEVKRDILEEYEKAKLNKLKLLLEKEEFEAYKQEIAFSDYKTKKFNECKEKLKTVTTKEEKKKIIKEFMIELGMLQTANSSNYKFIKHMQNNRGNKD